MSRRTLQLVKIIIKLMQVATSSIGCLGTLVATFSTNNGGTVSWTVSGVSSSDFAMDSSNGQLTIANPPDREVNLMLLAVLFFYLNADQSNVYVDYYSKWLSDSECT